MPALEQVVAAMRQAWGHDLAAFEPGFLLRSLSNRPAFASADAESYSRRLATDRTEADALLRSLQVSFSEFFRNPTAFALLEQHILPDLAGQERVSRGDEIRIWSAGCATGQEVWSLAILLDEMRRALERPIPYRIIGTDIGEADLGFASAGVYSVASVAKVRVGQLEACFSRQLDTYAIVPRLHANVSFSHHDLLDARASAPAASIYGGFDVVFCSNVLLYYRAETQRLILDRLLRSLAPAGYLIVDDTERQAVGRHRGLRALVPAPSVFQKVN